MGLRHTKRAHNTITNSAMFVVNRGRRIVVTVMVLRLGVVTMVVVAMVVMAVTAMSASLRVRSVRLLIADERKCYQHT